MGRARGRPKNAISDALRSRIVEEASNEFAIAGFRGTRIETIAKAAGCDRSLIYFYFKSKAGLFEAVLNEAAEHRNRQMVSQPRTLAEGLIYWFHQNLAEPRRIRLIMQEHLADAPQQKPSRRSAYLEEQLNVVRSFQAAGLIRAELEPRHLLTMFLALTSFPACFPHIAEVTLAAKEEQDVEREWSAFLRAVSVVLSPAERKNS